jgi:hypothetical protein
MNLPKALIALKTGGDQTWVLPLILKYEGSAAKPHFARHSKLLLFSFAELGSNSLHNVCNILFFEFQRKVTAAEFE